MSRVPAARSSCVDWPAGCSSRANARIANVRTVLRRNSVRAASPNSAVRTRSMGRARWQPSASSASLSGPGLHAAVRGGTHPAAWSRHQTHAHDRRHHVGQGSHRNDSRTGLGRRRGAGTHDAEHPLLPPVLGRGLPCVTSPWLPLPNPTAPLPICTTIWPKYCCLWSAMRSPRQTCAVRTSTFTRPVAMTSSRAALSHT